MGEGPHHAYVLLKWHLWAGLRPYLDPEQLLVLIRGLTCLRDFASFVLQRLAPHHPALGVGRHRLEHRGQLPHPALEMRPLPSGTPRAL